MEKVDPSLVGNQLVFPDDETLANTYSFMALDEAQPRVRKETAPMSQAAEAMTATADSGTFEGLRLRALTKEFANFTAVKSLDLDVPTGSFFALLGPSGCGKTTTLRMVAGLETPTRGLDHPRGQGHHL